MRKSQNKNWLRYRIKSKSPQFTALFTTSNGIHDEIAPPLKKSNRNNNQYRKRIVAPPLF